MLINFSNHPFEKWSDKQKEAASVYGDTVDVAFPAVPGNADESEVAVLAQESVNTIVDLMDSNPKSAVMVQGEFTLTYSIVSALVERGISAVSACSDRHLLVEQDEDGNQVKTVRFDFERFREYR